MGDPLHARHYRRLGNPAKCPACGWRMDPEAYRCPRCYIYFCFKCRARVTEHDPQFQCADQSCRCYGKLLCAACTVMIPEFKDVTRTVYEAVPHLPNRTVKVGDNLGYVALILPILVGLAFFVFSFWWGLAGAVATFIFVASVLVKNGSTWFKLEEVLPATTKQVPREITENKQVAQHRCCAQCRHPIKELR